MTDKLATVRLPSAPDEYDPRDQREMRRLIEQAVLTASVTPNVTLSTADSKAVSAGLSASVADSKAVSDSTLVSTADSKAVSAGSLGALDSSSASVADSKGVSAGSAASVADSKAVSDSVLVSTADSKAVSAGTLAVTDSTSASTADSKGVSAGTLAVTDSTSASTADSKAVSSGTSASVADSKAVSDSVLTSTADSKGVSAGGAASVADSKAVSDSVTTSTADSKGVSSGTRASVADSKAVSAAAADLPLTGGTLSGGLSGPTAIFGGGATTNGIATATFSGASNTGFEANETAGTADAVFAAFRISGTRIGYISRAAATSAVLYNTTSDERAKTNITAIKNAGEVLDGILAAEFEFKSSPGEKVRGFIAQQLNPLFHEAVSKGKTDDEMWGVDYGRITPLLVAEIQSLRKRLAILEAARKTEEP